VEPLFRSSGSFYHFFIDKINKLFLLNVERLTCLKELLYSSVAIVFSKKIKMLKYMLSNSFLLLMSFQMASKFLIKHGKSSATFCDQQTEFSEEMS